PPAPSTRKTPGGPDQMRECGRCYASCRTGLSHAASQCPRNQESFDLGAKPAVQIEDPFRRLCPQPSDARTVRRGDERAIGSLQGAPGVAASSRPRFWQAALDIPEVGAYE